VSARSLNARAKPCFFAICNRVGDGADEERHAACRIRSAIFFFSPGTPLAATQKLICFNEVYDGQSRRLVGGASGRSGPVGSRRFRWFTIDSSAVIGSRVHRSFKGRRFLSALFRFPPIRIKSKDWDGCGAQSCPLPNPFVTVANQIADREGMDAPPLFQCFEGCCFIRLLPTFEAHT